MEDRAAAVVGVLFDEAGEALPARPMDLARRLGWVTGDIHIVNYVVRELGFVHVAPLRDALLVKFEPATVRHLAVFAAFYEIAAHAPKRLILGCPGKVGSPDQYEIFNNPIEGLKRVEAALQRSQTSIAPAEAWSAGSPVERRVCERPQEPYLMTKRVAGLSGPSELAPKVPAGDRSKRSSRPLDSISPEDEWLGQVLGHWRDARSGWRLPSSESLDPLQLLNIARGRAHIVDTSQSDPDGYRFRLWGSVNSYGSGHQNKTLGEMPASLMRDNAIEDYWEVVTTGVPIYQLIIHVERKLPYSYARLLLPLASDGRRVDRLVVLINERPLPGLQVP